MGNARSKLLTYPKSLLVFKKYNDLKEGDIVEITFGQRTLKIRVKSIKDSVAKADAAEMYEIIE